MKPDPLAKLHDSLFNDLAWRKKEIRQLIIAAKQDKTQIPKSLIFRAAIPVIYAHWEGHVKISANLYLDYIASLGLKSCELADNLIALSARTKLSQLSENKQIIAMIDFIRDFRKIEDEPITFDLRVAINTESNLKFSVFLNILHSIGIDPDKYFVYSKFIDETLLKIRNGIAHGEHCHAQKHDFDSISEKVFNLLDMFNNDVIIASQQEMYLSQKLLENSV